MTWEWVPPIANVALCSVAVFFALMSRHWRIKAEEERERADAALAEARAILAAAQRLRQGGHR